MSKPTKDEAIQLLGAEDYSHKSPRMIIEKLAAVGIEFAPEPPQPVDEGMTIARAFLSPAQTHEATGMLGSLATAINARLAKQREELAVDWNKVGNDLHSLAMNATKTHRDTIKDEESYRIGNRDTRHVIAEKISEYFSRQPPEPPVDERMRIASEILYPTWIPPQVPAFFFSRQPQDRPAEAAKASAGKIAEHLTSVLFPSMEHYGKIELFADIMAVLRSHGLK